jgi:uncharacterized delta-60 repeat protein
MRKQIKKRPFGSARLSAGGIIAFWTTVFMCCAFAPSSRGYEEITGTRGVATNRATINFSALAKWEAEYKARRPTGERPQRANPSQELYRQETNDPPQDGAAMAQGLTELDAGAQSIQAISFLGPSPAPSVSFPALDDNNTSIPPDTHGAVGPNHVMTTLNTQVRIQDRQGNVLSTMDLNTFWAPAGFPDAFDPKLLYDPYENRWMFTAMANQFSFNSRVLIAVSETSDPTARWFLYTILADEFFNDWADYPSIGFNKDWITVSVNMFTSDFFFPQFTGVQMFVFDKANLYTNGLGNFTRLYVPTDPFFGFVNAFTVVPAVTYDPTASELYLVDILNFGNNFAQSQLRISTISGPVGTEILRMGFSRTTNAVNWGPTDFLFREGFAPQAGSTNLIENNDGRIQNVVYRNGSLWCTHTVFLPTGSPDHTAVQWWQIGPAPTNAITHQFGRIEDTNRVDYYAFPSIAVNRCSDVLIGYSSFSSNQFASANYSFRFGNDPTNALRDPFLLKAGEGPYLKTFFSGRNRWGDYSASVVDPANDLDMWTIQEYAETPVGDPAFDNSGRWGTWWGKVDVASMAQCGQIEFASSIYSVSEGAAVAVITVTNLTGVPGTVEWAASPGTAVDGVDYIAAPSPITFAAGQKSTNFTITLVDNGLIDSNRTVNLRLFNVTGAATLGILTNAVLVIVDDDLVVPQNISGEFNFSTYYDTNIHWLTSFFGPGYFVTENEGDADSFFSCGRQLLGVIGPDRAALGALVKITRTGGAVGRVMVDWATVEGGTAIAGQDYTPTNGTAIFDDFQMSTNVLVPIRSDFSFGINKAIRIVLSNPRPAPEEEAERPGIIRPALGPGAASQIVILDINNGEFLPFFFFGGGGGFSFTNFVPAFAFERLNYRVDEYPDNATEVSGGVRRVNIQVIFPFSLTTPPRAGGQVFLACNDPRARFGTGLGVFRDPFTQPGSDLAEAYTDPNIPDPDNDPDPFSGYEVYTNPTFTDPSLTTITNYTDYFATNLTLTFGQNDCRRNVTLYITNDATVEFDEDIVVQLFGIVGEQYFPNFWADQCTITILHHDQPAGALDREWNPDNVPMPSPNPDFNLVPGANNIVYAVAVQPDGKTLLAGEFTRVNGQDREGIARLEFDGGIDVSFQPGTGADGFVNAIALYPSNSIHSGKILISGDFSSFNGTPRKGVARLLANGQLDTSFNPGNGPDGPVLGMALQSDGRIVVVGSFSQFNNLARNRIARLLPDGDLDLSFNANPGPDNTIWSVTLVPSLGGPEKILIGGDFFSVNGAFQGHIAQLNTDGSLDGNFSAGSGANMSVYSVLVQPDGRLMVAGSFTTINDTPRAGVGRLHPDGTLDESFDPASGVNDSIYCMAQQPDGKVLIGGIFTSYNTTRRMGLARLRTDGTLDTSFLDTAYNQFAGFPQRVSFAPANYINSIALQADGNIIVGGSFTNVGGNPAARHVLRNRHTVFTRADRRTRFNIARLIGGVTPGPGNAQFDADHYFVDENAGTAAIRLDRTDGRLGTLLGLAVTQERFATPDLDYTHSTNANAWLQRFRFIGGALNAFPQPFSLGQVGPVYFRVPLLDDFSEEGDELINLQFLRTEATLNLSGEIIPLGGALGRSSAILDLVDNDFPRGTFNFLVSNYITNEFATFAMIAVIRTNGSVGTVSVEYFTRNSTNSPSATGGATCSAGVDYQTTRGRLQFTSGQTTNFFPVRICTDGNVEFDENIELVLTNATGGARLPGALQTSVATATLTIIDDDFTPGRVNFASTTFNNSESDGFAAIKVTRTGGSVGTVSVGFRTVNGTAGSPADYISTNGVFTWNDSDTSARTLLIPLAQDGLVEGTENFRLELFNPMVNQAPNATLLGARTNAVASIADGDAYGVLAFNQPYFQADENGGSVTITVLRTGGSAGTVFVDYSASAESAVPGLDFTPVSGTLTLVPGQFSATFSVPLADDPQSDGNKVVQLELSNPVNAALGIPSAVDLVLVDNESFNNPPGELDATFDSTAQANGPVYSIALYLTNGVPDGRLMIAGDFGNVNNIARQGLARLNANGSLDTTFTVGTGPNAPVRAMAIQADGRILFGGFFSQVTGTNRNGIARVNIEGTLDTSFDPGSGADGPIYAIAVQPDQKILAAGAFGDFDLHRLPGIIRLLPNGRVDNTFNTGTGPQEGVVFAFAVQPDGRILIGGDFKKVNGVQRPGIARLHRNGSVDTSFDPGSGTDLAVRAIIIQPDGKIVIGGSFTTVNGVPRNYLARLDRDGTLDSTFMSGLSGGNNSVQALALHTDGKIVVAGDFTRFHDVTRNHITRLNPDGTTDTTINFGTGANAFIATLAIQPDRRIVLGGAFTTYDNHPRSRIARIYGGSVAGPGSLEFLVQQFSVSEMSTNAIVSVRRRGGTTGTVGVDFFTADDTALDGRDYIGTNLSLTFPSGEVLRTVPIRVLLNPAPSEDLRALLNLRNYTGGAAVGSRPTAVLMIRNEQALISFAITNYTASEGIPGGLATIEVSRALATNSLVTVDFSAIAAGSAQTFADFIPTNGTLVFQSGQVSRSFNVRIIDDSVIEGQETLNLVLSNPGQNSFLDINRATLTIMDNDFAPGQLFFSSANYFVDEAGGFVELSIFRTNGSRGVVSVDLLTRDGTATVGDDYASAFRRLSLGEDETNGTFTVAVFDDLVVEGNETFLVTMSNPGGGAIISGPTNAVVTIVENDFGPGNLIREFDPGEGANNYVRTLAVQADGKIVVGGAFTTFDNTNRNYITRLNVDGSHDLSFDAGSGADSLVSTLAIGLDQRIFVGGTFTRLNNVSYTRVGRLLTNGMPDPNFVVPGFNAVVHSIDVQTNGHLVVGGNFSLPSRSLSQLQVNGRVDATFVVGAGADNLVHAVAAYEDGAVIAAGGFTNFSGHARSRVVRLRRDGSVDSEFVPASITNGIIYAVAIQTNGQIVIGGDFHLSTSATRYSLARLNADGSLDTSFRGINGINGIVFAIGLQANGRLVIGGSFTTVDGFSRSRYARLNTNGSVDDTFNPGIGANNTVYAISVLPDENILIGGEFTLVNGITRRGVAKIRGNDREARFLGVTLLGNGARLTMTSTPGVNYILQASSNLVNWTSLSTNNASSDTMTLFDPAANLHQKRFYRVRQAGQ